MANIIIDENELHIILERNRKFLNPGADWTTPLGIIISLIFTQATSTFNNTGFISSKAWELIWLICFLSMSLWLILSVIFWVKKKKVGTEKLYNEICELDQTIIEHRLLLLFSDLTEHQNEILVYEDPVWKCYLLPHFPIQENQREPDIANEYIEKEFRLKPQDYSMPEKIDTQRSDKLSRRTQAVKHYIFEYYKVRLLQTPDVFKHKNFEIAGRKYFWLSLDGLQKDDRTMEYNRDVVNFLEKNIRINL